MSDAFEIRLLSILDRGVYRGRISFDRELERLRRGENTGKWRRHLIGQARCEPRRDRSSLCPHGHFGVAHAESWIDRDRGVGR